MHSRHAATISAMELLALYFSAFGRLAPEAFRPCRGRRLCRAFLSQLLISPAVMFRLGLAPFALVQAMTIWALVLSPCQTLARCRSPAQSALAIAVLYALGMILLISHHRIAAGMAPGGVEAPRGAATDVLISSYLVTVLAGDPDPGFFAFVGSGILRADLRPHADCHRVLDPDRKPAERGAHANSALM